jgi:hypothetical protein
MHVALDDLQLTRLFVIYPGEKEFSMDERIEAISLASVNRVIERMR